MSSSNRGRQITGFIGLLVASLTLANLSQYNEPVAAQNQEEGEITVLSDVQEADLERSIVTWTGNVRIFYPSRQIQATAVQAQYFDRERRLVLSGNVIVLQEGNSIRGEVMTYLLDERRFIAVPKPSEQVESTYIIEEEPQAETEPTTDAIELPTTPEF